MKPSEFKQLIKSAVKEAFQEELKEILLEAVKAPKISSSGEYKNITENYAQPNIDNPKQLSASERRAMFSGMLEDMGNGNKQVITTDSIPFRPTGPVDPVSGALPQGEVGLDLIMGLMNPK